MAEKYFAAPTTAQEISSLYEKGKEYNNKLDLSNTVETNRNFLLRQPVGKVWTPRD